MSARGTASGAPARSWRILTLVALALLTIAAFEGVRSNGWILLDDHVYVADDAHVRTGFTWANFTWFLHAFHVGNWHPLTSWSHMLDVQVFGSEPLGPHVENLALHVVNACLLLAVLARLTGSWWRSAFAAAFFALHPLRVESVAWIAERKDVLSTFFFLVTLWAYARWAERPSRWRFAAVECALVLGLMAKPMLVTLPCVLVLLDFWPLGRIRSVPAGAWRRDLWNSIAEKWLLFATVVAGGVVTVVAQSSSGATPSLEQLSFATRVATAIRGYATYVRQSFVPEDLAVIYPYERTFSVGFVLLLLAGLVATTVLCWRAARSKPYLFVGWAWFLGTLVPVVGFVQVGPQSHADRYTYIPHIGLAILVVWGVSGLVAARRTWRSVSIVAGCAASVFLMLATRARVERWRTTRTLFAHTLAVTPDNAVAEKVYADAMIADGEMDQAIAHFERALRIQPIYPEVSKNLGCALGYKGRVAEASVQFREAVRWQPTRDNLFNLACSLAELHQFEESIGVFRRALAVAPDDVLVNVRFGQALGTAGRVDEAIVRFRHALDVEPGNAEARRTLAIALTMKGDVEGAIACYQRLLERDPDDVDALNNVAWIRATHRESTHRDGTVAVAAAERARDRSREPDAVLSSTLAAAYAEAGRFEEAVAAATRAVDLARARGAEADARRFAEQLELYRAHKPLHMP